MALYALTYEQGLMAWVTPQADQWVERADRYARPDTAERALVDAILGVAKYSEGDIRSGNRLMNQSIDLAHRTGDRYALLWGASAFFLCCSAPQHTEQRIRLAEELWASSHVRPNASLQTITLFIGDVFLVMGQRQRAEEVWGELRVWATRTRNITLELPSAGMDAVLTLMDGRLEDAMDMAESIRTRGREAGIEGLSNLFSIISGIRAQVYLGASLEARERELPHGSLIAMQELCLVQAHLGRKEEVSEILDKYVVSRPGIGTVEDETRSWVDTLYLEASVLVTHRQAAELLLNRLSGTGLYTTGYSFPTCIARHLGGAAALLERYDEARQYYQEAIKVCTEIRFRPELALTRLQLAELLLEHYPKEKSEALEHLDFAINEFREMKMQPSLERALRHKDILKA